ERQRYSFTWESFASASARRAFRSSMDPMIPSRKTAGPGPGCRVVRPVTRLMNALGHIETDSRFVPGRCGALQSWAPAPDKPGGRSAKKEKPPNAQNRSRRVPMDRRRAGDRRRDDGLQPPGRQDRGPRQDLPGTVARTATPARVEPVRSVRQADPYLVNQSGKSLFGNASGSPPSLAALDSAVKAGWLVDVGYSTGGGYVRDGGRISPHNLYTSTQALYARPDARGLPNATPIF